MIVFTIVFGEKYIERFFERSLPSLFGPDRPLDLGGEKLSLFIFTLSRDERLVHKHLRGQPLKYFEKIGDINIITGNVDGMPETHDDPQLVAAKNRAIACNLLIRAMKLCIERDEVFLHAVPDLVYSAATVNTCYHLHRLTGKNVAIFNGRVAPKNDSDFTLEELLNISASPHDMVRFFFENMNKVWAQHYTSDFNRITGQMAGHLIYQLGPAPLIFCSHPNPILGKFKPIDIPHFTNKSAFAAWDHGWKDFLLLSNRLVVQTGLDLGMSVEPESAASGDHGFWNHSFDWAMQAFGAASEQAMRREYKFGSQSFLFTTSYRK